MPAPAFAFLPGRPCIARGATLPVMPMTASLNDYPTVKKDTLPRQIAKSIRDMVLEGRLKPGDRLPSEQDLVRRFGVSRPTLREVLRVLEAQGLVAIRQGAGGGIFVREVDMDVTRRSLINFLHQTDLSLEHLFEVRRILDPHFAQRAATGASPEDLALLETIVAEQRRHLDGNDLVGARGAEIRFHRALARVCDNPLLVLLQDFIETLLERVKARLSPGRAFSESAFEHHTRILEALAAHDEAGARERMLEDLASVEASLRALGASRQIDWMP